MRLVAIIIVVILATQSIVTAGEMTGNDLFKACNRDDVANQVYCRKFIFGVVQGYTLGLDVGLGKVRQCIPATVTESQLALIVEKKMKEIPEKLHEPAVSIVIVAIVQAFPDCGQL